MSIYRWSPLSIQFATTGNASLVEINTLRFTPEDHTLLITFTDVNGNEGISSFNFTGRTREGEFPFKRV